MKKNLPIRSVRSFIDFSESTLENYVNNFPHKRNSNSRLKANPNFFLKEFENIEVRSAHAPVNATVEIIFSAKRNNDILMNVPLITGFFFTCIKGKDGFFKINWSCSMS